MKAELQLKNVARSWKLFRIISLRGNDGIPIEFYKKCWNLICEPFINCVNESFKKEEMSNSQRQAVITLIEKKVKIVRA